MDDALIDRLVHSVLYEGYLLYPYRPALKNTRRVTFGTLFPATSHAVCAGAERSSTRARVLLVGGPTATIEGQVRFLQFIERRATAATGPSTLWHECEERRIDIPSRTVAEIVRRTSRQRFEVPAPSSREAGPHSRDAVSGALEIAGEKVGDGISLISVSIANETPCGTGSGELQSLASTHLILRAGQGEFVSKIDPPAAFRDLCPHDPADGLWPVLVGTPGERDAMLCSPIILYDYPQIAPESPGDFFDATEIDEMLTLRILTLSDEEKLQVAALDARGRALLSRTDQFAEEHLARLHGATRSFRPIEGSADGH